MDYFLQSEYEDEVSGRETQGNKYIYDEFPIDLTYLNHAKTYITTYRIPLSYSPTPPLSLQILKKPTCQKYTLLPCPNTLLIPTQPLHQQPRHTQFLTLHSQLAIKSKHIPFIASPKLKCPYTDYAEHPLH
jgi:hypothetical protein